MTEKEQTEQGAIRASNELDGFAKQLAAWNAMSQDARVLASSERRPRPAAGLPADLATEWIKKATCRSASLTHSIRSLERDLARRRHELLEAQRLERQSAIAAVVVVMRRLGITLEDLTDQKREAIAHAPREKARPASPPPAPRIGPRGQIWLGHGRRPRWLKQFLASGGQLDDLRETTKTLVTETA